LVFLELFQSSSSAKLQRKVGWEEVVRILMLGIVLVGDTRHPPALAYVAGERHKPPANAKML
jgi:hypothetical protein